MVTRFLGELFVQSFEIPSPSQWSTPIASSTGRFVLWPTPSAVEVWTASGELLQRCPQVERDSGLFLDDEGSLWWASGERHYQCHAGVKQVVVNTPGVTEQRPVTGRSCLPDRLSSFTSLSSAWALNTEFGLPFYCGSDLTNHIHELTRVHPLEVSKIKTHDTGPFPPQSDLEVFEP